MKVEQLEAAILPLEEDPRVVCRILGAIESVLDSPIISAGGWVFRLLYPKKSRGLRELAEAIREFRSRHGCAEGDS